MPRKWSAGSFIRKYISTDLVSKIFCKFHRWFVVIWCQISRVLVYLHSQLASYSYAWWLCIKKINKEESIRNWSMNRSDQRKKTFNSCRYNNTKIKKNNEPWHGFVSIPVERYRQTRVIVMIRIIAHEGNIMVPTS